MVRALVAATGREREAEALIDAELRRLLPALEWLVSTILVRRRISFCGDPTLFDGLLDGAAELGVEVRYLGAPARRPEYGCELDPQVHGAIPPVSFAAPRTTVARHLMQLDAQLDLLIGGDQTPTMPEAETARLEFGFPSFFRHALFDAPYLGFRGWAWFVQELGNALMHRRR